MRLGVLVFLGSLVLISPVDQAECLTVQEIVSLKKAGVSEETIQLIIRQENDAKARHEAEIREVEDEKGRRSTVYTTGGDEETRERRLMEQEKEDRSWEMLRNITIEDEHRKDDGKNEETKGK